MSSADTVPTLILYAIIYIVVRIIDFYQTKPTDNYYYDDDADIASPLH